MQLNKYIMVALWSTVASAQPYDLILKGGHVIDPANRVNRVADVAIAAGKVAAVGNDLSGARAMIDCAGKYVTPGLVDIHTHVYVRGRSSTLLPDDAVLPHGTTTIVDAGVSGWKSFDDFKAMVIDRATVRVLALLNIVGSGMNDDQRKEDLVEDMDPEKTAAKIRENRSVLVGVKSAHFGRPGWASVERAIQAGRLADVPVMLDSSVYTNSDRTTRKKVLEVMRPGDLHTHAYNDHQLELVNRFNGKVEPWMWEARKRGVLFDLGHGGGSFMWPVARAAMSGGFPPDVISTDLHPGSILTLRVNMLNSMAKLMSLGMTIEDAVERATVNPAKAIRRFPEVGTLSVGAVADVAVIDRRTGVFALIDSLRKKHTVTNDLEGALTVRAGRVVYDRDGITLAAAGAGRSTLGAVPEAATAAPSSGIDTGIYDIVLKGGLVMDPANRRTGRFDIAVTGRTIRKIAPSIAAANARLVVDVGSYFVTPGLIDSGAEVDFLASPTAVPPDHHSIPDGVTVVVAKQASPIVVRRSRVRVISRPTAMPENALASGMNHDTVLMRGAGLAATMTLLLNEGVSFADLVDRATRIPAAALNRADLGTLREGGPADIAVLAVRRGSFALPGLDGLRHSAGAKVEGVLTMREGDIVWDRHGLSMREWTQAGGYWSFR